MTEKQLNKDLEDMTRSVNKLTKSIESYMRVVNRLEHDELVFLAITCPDMIKVMKAVQTLVDFIKE